MANDGLVEIGLLLIWILGLSIFLQLIAAGLAVRLIFITGRRTAWILLSMAIFLMGLQRGITFYEILHGQLPVYSISTAEYVALSVSILMLAGIARIGPYFLSIHNTYIQDVSKRKKVEETLRLNLEELEKSKAYLEIFSNSAMEGLITINDYGIIETFNKSAEKIFGHGSPEVIGKNVSILMPEPYRSAHDLYLEKHRKSGENKIFNLRRELAGLRKDGTEFPVEFSINVMYLGGDRKFIGSMRDITERKNAEGELRKLSQAVEQSPSVVLITDPRGAIEYVNPKFVETSGYTFEEVRGKNPRILKSGGIKPERYSKLWQTLSAGREWRGEFHNRRKNGELYWEFASISPIFDDNGKITHFLALKEDITERKKNEKQLTDYADNLQAMVDRRTSDLNTALAESEESRNKIDAIIKSVSEGLVVTNIRSRIILMNPAAEEIFGVCFRDVANQPIDSVIIPENIKERIKNTLRVNSQGCSFDFDLPENGLKGGRTFQVKTSMIQDRDGLGMGVLMTARDVTRERDIDRMKTEFLSIAAHELRTPLTTIQGFSEVLVTRKNLQAEQEERYLNYINEEAEHLSHIVSDLLSISRIEAGLGFSYVKTTCRVVESIEKALTQIKKHFPRQYFATFCEENIQWLVDEEKMIQVLLNLYSNAVKYSPNEDLIKTSVNVRDGFVMVSIADKGVGMTPEQLQRVFDKFYRADTLSKVVEGTGLGMTIVKTIVESHGGRVSVESDYGKGTTVRFTIPATDRTARLTDS